MNHIRLSCAMMMVAGFGGCGDDSASPVDAANEGDTAPDQEQDNPDGLPGPIGGACVDGVCPAGQSCFDRARGARLSAHGICSLNCTTNDDCGSNGYCSPPIAISPEMPGGERFCLRRCATEADCDAEHVCSAFLGENDGNVDALPFPACVPGGRTASMGDPCTDWGDCSDRSACLRGPYTNPAGLCMKFCDVDGDCAERAGSTCLDGVCLISCAVDTDCRSTEGYSCQDLGDISLCDLAIAFPGDACLTNTDCGPPTSAWRCLTGADFPGGYCGGPCDVPGGCINASCYDPTPAMPSDGDEYCALDCADKSGSGMFFCEARMAEGYACRAPAGGSPVSPCLGPI